MGPRRGLCCSPGTPFAEERSMNSEKWDNRVLDIHGDLQRTDISDSRRLKLEQELEALIDLRLKEHPERLAEEELARVLKANAPEELV